MSSSELELPPDRFFFPVRQRVEVVSTAYEPHCNLPQALWLWSKGEGLGTSLASLTPLFSLFLFD